MAKKDPFTLSLFDMPGPPSKPRESLTTHESRPAPLLASAQKPRELDPEVMRMFAELESMNQEPPPWLAGHDERRVTADLGAAPLSAALAPPEGPDEEVAELAGVSKDSPLSVAALGQTVREMLAGSFPIGVWVTGEVTGLRKAGSGHLYFTLKDPDADANLDVVMYRTSVSPRVVALAKDGAQVKLRGKPTFWEPRGRLQFVADRAEAAGRGALLEALEKLKAQLTKEGLFAEHKKRALPSAPRVIGVVSSASGAVIHDIRKVAFRRGGARILLAPAVVQGASAAASILRALSMITRVSEVDVVIIARGGGASDDLACFNDERVVRAVAACRVPIVSAVGHETDVTLTDFAADVRAATPSQAAEMVTRDRTADKKHLADLQHRLVRAATHELTRKQGALLRLRSTLGDPRYALARKAQAKDERDTELRTAIRRIVEAKRAELDGLTRRLGRLHPGAAVQAQLKVLGVLSARLQKAIESQLQREQRQLGTLQAKLEALSPLRVLARGYAIAFAEDGSALLDADRAKLSSQVRVRLHRGELRAQVIDRGIGSSDIGNMDPRAGSSGSDP
jgi:exodeoxyribonuclease VII large subunit